MDLRSCLLVVSPATQKLPLSHHSPPLSCQCQRRLSRHVTSTYDTTAPRFQSTYSSLASSIKTSCTSLIPSAVYNGSSSPYFRSVSSSIFGYSYSYADAHILASQ